MATPVVSAQAPTVTLKPPPPPPQTSILVWILLGLLTLGIIATYWTCAPPRQFVTSITFGYVPLADGFIPFTGASGQIIAWQSSYQCVITCGRTTMDLDVTIGMDWWAYPTSGGPFVITSSNIGGVLSAAMSTYGKQGTFYDAFGTQQGQLVLRDTTNGIVTDIPVEINIQPVNGGSDGACLVVIPFAYSTSTTGTGTQKISEWLSASTTNTVALLPYIHLRFSFQMH